MNKVAIYGGLGNQMFQYALCVALNRRGIKSRISFSNYLYSFHHHGFNLCNAFKIKLRIPHKLLNAFLNHGTSFYKNRFAGFILKRVIPNYRSRSDKYLEKKEFEYDPEVFKLKDRFLIGIWQVEEYFRDIRETILEEFDFKVPVDIRNSTLIEKINHSDSVSIHIRRGDYLNERWNNILGVIQGTSYFNNAAKYLEEKVKNPCYFVFSDDIAWAKENLKLVNSVYVDHNKGKESYIDMYLMSLCKHNIIANSTFSWWAAWLNRNVTKMVIMPEKWIINEKCEGIFPPEWIKMKTD